jgi:hypothetical protein
MRAGPVGTSTVSGGGSVDFASTGACAQAQVEEQEWRSQNSLTAVGHAETDRLWHSHNFRVRGGLCG